MTDLLFTNQYVEVLREGVPNLLFTNQYVEVLRGTEATIPEDESIKPIIINIIT